MAAIASERSLPFFLTLPATNLSGWAPEGSVWSRDLNASGQARRDDHLDRARRQLAAGNRQAALAAVDAALAIDPRPASAHFLRGRMLYPDHPDEALQAFRQARDRDAVPIRLTGPLEELIRQTWDRMGLGRLDAQAIVAAASPAGVPGNHLLLDYCHPSPQGHRIIAAGLLPAIAAALWPGSDWGPVVAERLLPPSGEGAEAMQSAFGAAWAGQMRVRQGNPREAAALFRQAILLDPLLSTAHEGLGRLLAVEGRYEEAMAHLRLATEQAPQSAQAWNSLGQAYRGAGELERALAAYDRALAAGGGRGVVQRNRALTLLRLGRAPEALTAALEATRASPADPLAWVQLGEVFLALGKRQEAVDAYRRALRIDPAAPTAAQVLESLEQTPGKAP